MDMLAANPAQLLAAAADARAADDAARARDSLLAARVAGEEVRERAMREAAQEFEAVFLSQMLAPMFAGLSTDGPFGGGHAEEIFRSMQIDEMGRAIARSGGVGLADVVYREMLRYQEASP